MVEISDRIDFKLSYIGKPTDHDDGVECKHGETECLGNMIELCAADKYPDPKIYLGFTYCLTRQYQKIPERHMIQDCAMEHGIDFARINDCLTQDDGGYVADLLQASFIRSAEANVSTSCTVSSNRSRKMWMVTDSRKRSVLTSRSAAFVMEASGRTAPPAPTGTRSSGTSTSCTKS